MKLMEAYRNKKKLEVKIHDKEYTLHAWLDHWHNVFRLPKKGKELSFNTIKNDLVYIKKIKQIFKNVKITELTADTVQQTLNEMTLGRTCEGVCTILKLALSKAKDRTDGRRIMDMADKVKHKRKRGRALSNDEVCDILDATRNESERDIIKTYIYTGCRADELTRIHVKHVDLAGGFIFIDGTKTKLSKRSMPIMPPLRPILERLVAGRDGEEKLFNHTVNTIRNFHKVIKEKLETQGTPISFTIKDYRHTAATNFKDVGIPSSVYFRWFGWSDDTMARQVYTHVTEYESNLSHEWAQKFIHKLERSTKLLVRK